MLRCADAARLAGEQAAALTVQLRHRAQQFLFGELPSLSRKPNNATRIGNGQRKGEFCVAMTTDCCRQGSGGVTPPSHWPYDASSLAAAQAWCCKHADCGGITHQNGRYEVRAGATPIANPGGSTAASSFLRKGLAKLDQANLTRCVVTAELDFTQATGGDYAQRAASDKTVALSRSLIDKYAGHF